jgi:hypothetical protein
MINPALSAMYRLAHEIIKRGSRHRHEKSGQGHDMLSHIASYVQT